MITATDPNTQAMLDKLLSRKGQIVTMLTERDCKVRKGRDPIRKRSEFQCRVGVNYDNIKTVIEGRADGSKPAENAGLPWGEWALFPYVITHKGEYYIRCTTLPNGNHKPAQFLRNGNMITREEAQADCLASEFSEGDRGEVFNIKVSSLVELR